MKDAINLALWVSAPYLNDAILADPNPADPDKRLASFCRLKSAIENLGGSCHTQDVFLRSGQIPDVVLFLDIPVKPVSILLREWGGKVRKWVLLQECGVIIPRNWDMSLHAQFDRIFTWNDGIVDDKRYFKFNYGNILPTVIPKNLARKNKLCAIIAGHRRSGHFLELYSKREETARWFEQNHPADFDLYGYGWDEYVFGGPRFVRALNRVKFLKRLFAPAFPSYKGQVQNKVSILENYRFSICYENSRDAVGYITEKIFDCFAAGCVPVYWGALNIKDHIPAECFLDKRVFPSYEALYERMNTMTDVEYLSRLAAIESFLKSEKGREFSVEGFAETIVKGLP